MAQSKTNNFAFAYAIEASLATLPGSPIWKSLEPNDLTNLGATISTVSRTPISGDRQERKGTVTDLDSAAEFEHDLTIEAFNDFAEGFVFSKWQGTQLTVASDSRKGFLTSYENTLVADASLPTNAGPGFTHDALSAALLDNTLVFVRGFDNSANNGLFVVDNANSTTTETSLKNTPAIVDQTPAATDNATLEVAGIRGASSDLDWDDSANAVTSTALDFTTLGLTVGQFVHIGGTTSSTQFANGTAYGRVSVIDTNQLTFDKLVNVGTGTLSGGGDLTPSGQIDLLFGRFLKNVAVSDANFLERSFQFEAAYDDLQNPAGTGDEYEYSVGNLCNSMAITLPLTDKAGVTFGFIGTDTEEPTTTRKTNAANPIKVSQQTAFNTSSDIARLRIAKVDETGITTCFKDLTLTLNNNVSPEKCLGTLGAVFMNTGNFQVQLETQVVFTDSEVAKAVRNNTTVSMEFVLKNDDGGIAFDIPSMTLGGGDKEFPVNESILINITGSAFKDATLDTSIGISMFPALP